MLEEFLAQHYQKPDLRAVLCHAGRLISLEQVLSSRKYAVAESYTGFVVFQSSCYIAGKLLRPEITFHHRQRPQKIGSFAIQGLYIVL